MELSVREAASILGRSPRTIRAQLCRGDLPGRKRDGRWVVPRESLPLTEAQRRVLQERADDLRRTLDEALPSRLAATRGRRGRSIADVDAFRRGVALLEAMRREGEGLLSGALMCDVPAHLERALLSLAEAVSQYDPRLKLAALNASRAEIARALARLFLHGGIPPKEPMWGWASIIESEILPAVAGLARWAERLERRRP